MCGRGGFRRSQAVSGGRILNEPIKPVKRWLPGVESQRGQAPGARHRRLGRDDPGDRPGRRTDMAERTRRGGSGRVPALCPQCGHCLLLVQQGRTEQAPPRGGTFRTSSDEGCGPRHRRVEARGRGRPTGLAHAGMDAGTDATRSAASARQAACRRIANAPGARMRATRARPRQPPPWGVGLRTRRARFMPK